MRLAGHDVATVQRQGLSSASDPQVIEVCRLEERCLITGDRGFGDRMKFNPANYWGIVVIRLPANSTFENWQQAIETLMQGLENAEVKGKLWIVKKGAIQEYQAIEDEDKE